MSPHDKEQFEALKQQVVAVMQQAFPGINPSITEWKGQEITDFQEELRRKVGANVSEKWFYMHMKASQPSLPRIDVLNFLSRYAGYANWDDFVFRTSRQSGEPGRKQTSNRFFILVPLLALGVLAVFFGFFLLFNTREYRFCFIDADTKEPVTGGNITVTLIPGNESPVTMLCGADGCLSLKTGQGRIRMVVTSPYYRSDTIVRILKKFGRREMVALHANEYALMIHYFSQEKVADWEKRRRKLEAVFCDDAMICQVFGDRSATGMELLNRGEFIDRLSMPAGSLRNLEVLDTRFRGEKISFLKFRVKPAAR